MPTFEQLTVSSTAVGLATTTTTSANDGQQNRFVCRLEQGQIRYRVDGGNPTTSLGTLLEVGDVLELTSNVQGRRFKAIRTTTTDGILNVNGLEQ